MVLPSVCDSTASYSRSRQGIPRKDIGLPPSCSEDRQVFFVGIVGLGARFPKEGRGRHGKTIAWTAVIGNGGLLLFLFLYMTFGYVLWGV
ncbi:hypothetical protein [Paenibacillus harenae]|uniref:hypothetical protein n=1 Tax=Paenibacillus harenae TaxID=306543 RepID=UPI0027D79EE6|nr:hypothetical protein [Paenibacillus harenae]